VLALVQRPEALRQQILTRGARLHYARPPVSAGVGPL
jgi:hypothetical protein